MSTAPAAPAAAPAAPVSTSAAMAAPAAPATPAAPAAPAAPSTNEVNPGAWMAGFNDDDKGWVTNKGYKGPGDVVAAHRSLEKLLGAPKDRLVTLPEQFFDDKTGQLTAEGRAIYERLGAPKDAKEYGIEAPKEGGDPKRLENFLKNAQELGLTKKQAQQLAKADGEYHAGLQTQASEAAAATFRDQDAALRKEWGAAFDTNRSVAADAMTKLKLTPAQVDAMAGQLGHHETMKLLCNIGKSVGESAFVTGQRANTPMEPAGALARINELKTDREFGGRLMNGDAEAKATWERLHKEAYPGMLVSL